MVSRGKERLHDRRGRTAQSTRWLERQLSDPYVRRARAEGWRSRAAFKLIELDERFGFLKGAERVVDLGVAPGGWTQVVRRMRPAATVVGIDLLPVEPIAGATLIEGDLREPACETAVLAALGGAPDLVLSDMAANTTGHRGTDHLRTLALVEIAAAFATEHLAEGGHFVCKLFAGGAEPGLLAELKRSFASVRHAKPAASRKESVELYLVAIGRKPSS